MQDLSGQSIKGYELQEQIGAGGFGAVYRAFQPLIKRDVAIKIILPEHANQPDFIRRFEHEAQLVARLEHIHIVALYDYWRDPQGAYLVMRWLRGGSLRQRLKRIGVVDNDVAVHIVDQVGAALGAAHRRGIVHRDIKPDNILFDEDGNAYLADFGIARDLQETTVEDDEQQTDEIEEETLTGSPFYLAPEQAQSQPVSPQTDLYSLGIVTYEMLTGQPPFSGDKGLMPLLLQHIQEPIPSVRDLRPDLPDEVDTVLQRATAKDPLSRYQDANSLAVDFRRALLKATEPLPSGPEVEVTLDGEPAGDDVDDLLVITKPMTPATLIVVPPEEVVNPYKGLQAFEEADASDFFGRETLIETLLDRMRERVAQGRFLAVIGPSGSGKSSVVKAGVIPALRRNALRNSDQWYMAEMTPGTDPFRELTAALLSMSVSPPPGLQEHLRTDEHALVDAINAIVPHDSTSAVMLTIDQFEEVFTLVEDESERAHFLKLLQTAIADLDCPFRLIITLRADFFDRPLLYPDFGELVRNRNEVVLPLAVDELRAAIVGPAERIGVSVETGLVAAIVAELGEQHGALPLLQYALTELFEHRDDNVMTLAAYQETGGVLGALARRAEDLYQATSPAGQDVLRQMFLRMVTVGEGEDDTRRRVQQVELMGLTDDDDLVLDLLDDLSKARLLTFDRDPDTRMPVVTIAHEALIRGWDQYRAWLDDSREDLLLQRRVSQANHEWIAHGRDESFMVTGVRLQQFETLLADDATIALTPEEVHYIEAAITLREAREAAERARAEREARLEARARRFLQGIAAVLFVGIVVAVVLALLALDQRAQAEDQRDIAEEQRDIAQREAEVNRSLLLVSQAQQEMSSYNTDSALVCAIEANAIPDPPASAQQTWFDVALAPGTERVLSGHAAGVNTGVFSPDGTFAISGGGADDPTLIVWDVATGDMLRQSAPEHTNSILDVALSPDGTTALSASRDNTIILWDVATLDVLARLEGHTDWVYKVAFSPDGTTALSSSKDDTVILWDIAERTQLHQFDDSEVEIDADSGEAVEVELGADEAANVIGVLSLAYTPDGSAGLFGGRDGSLELWDLTSYELIRSYEGHASENNKLISALAFSADGSQFLSGGTIISLWDTENTEAKLRFKPDAEGINSALFSQNGQHFFTADTDQNIIGWELDADNGLLSEVMRFTGHEGSVNQIDLSPDGYRILSASGDKTLRVWSLLNGAELGRFDGAAPDIRRLRTTPGNSIIVASSFTGLIQVWNTETREPINTWADPPIVFDAVPSADGSMVFSVGLLKNPTVWDVATGDIIRQFGELNDLAFSVDLSRDGQYAVAGTGDSKVFIWDVATGELVREFTEHTQPVWSVAFSPDGQQVLSGANNKIMLLWDVATGDVIHEFDGFDGSVDNIVFSPDGQFGLATSGSIISLWDLDTGQLMRTFEGHDEAVTRAVFNTTGDQIASSSSDGTLRVWDVATGSLVRQLSHGENVTGTVFSPDGQTVISAAPDSTVREWEATPLSLDRIRQWTEESRYVPTDETCLPAASE